MLVLFLILSIHLVHAFSVNLDPPGVRWTLAPGETKEGVLTLTQTGKQSTMFKAYLQDWSYLPDGTKAFYQSGTIPGSCAKWMDLNVNSFRLEPADSQTVTYSISVPASTAGGQYHAVAFFESLIGTTTEKINVAGRIGTIFYITVPTSNARPLAPVKRKGKEVIRRIRN